MQTSNTGAPIAGHLVASRYRLLEPIGAGGMAEVWRAHDEHLDRDVAVKLLQGAEATDAENEARIAARLVHPNIVRVYDVGTDDDLKFVVMELVSGAPLSTLRDTGQLTSPAQIVDIGVQLAEALEHAHQAGVIHCDVKPQNVVVTDHGIPKLLDFGISRRLVGAAQPASDEFLGSLPYVAPEQVRGDPLDGRTDVFALGALLYELLTGQTPFASGSTEESLQRRLHSPPPALRTLAPAVPPSIDSLVLRALATDPADRFQSAGELVEALRTAAPSLGGSEAVTERYPAIAGRPIGFGRSGRKAAVLGLLTAGLAVSALVGMCSARSPHDDATSIAPALAEPQASPTSTPEPTSTPQATLAAPTIDAPVVNTGPPPQTKPAAPQQASPPQVKPEEKEHTPPGQAKKPKGKGGRD